MQTLVVVALSKTAKSMTLGRMWSRAKSMCLSRSNVEVSASWGSSDYGKTRGGVGCSSGRPSARSASWAKWCSTMLASARLRVSNYMPGLPTFHTSFSLNISIPKFPQLPTIGSD